MKAVCACLAGAGGAELNADFFERGWIVGHYDNKASFDSEDYGQRGANQLEKMRKKAESSDPYLCSLRVAKRIGVPDERTSDGQLITSEDRKIGVIEPDTTPMYVFRRDEDHYESFNIGEKEAAKAAFQEASADNLYKIVPMGDDQRVIRGDNYRLNEYETPNTFSPWNTFAEQLQALFEGEKLPKMSPTSYTSDQTEVLCEEYIRTLFPEFFPLIQTGGSTGTNQGVDILGEAGGKTIIGEVKNKDYLEEDVLSTLRNYSVDDVEAYYFIRGGGSAEGVNIVAIETVLEELANGFQNKMLERMTEY
jgi:hypothetical protein